MQRGINFISLGYLKLKWSIKFMWDMLFWNDLKIYFTIMST